jgi:hypothetical protein
VGTGSTAGAPSTGDASPTAGAGQTGNEAGAGDPGFGDVAGSADLPSMVDTLPTFDEDYGATGAGDNSMPGAEESGEGSNGDSGSETAATSGTSGASGNASSGTGTGTRAGGGMDSNRGAEGPMTSAERVAILDRQLEESTRDFDGIIYDEEQRQREADRERASRNSPPPAREERPEQTITSRAVFDPISERAPGGFGEPSAAVKKYPAPADIPDNPDDNDIIAKQLYEAASREPDPVMREKLWNEYRKYTGIDETE